MEEEFTKGAPRVRGRPFERQIDWSIVGVVGVSVAVGAVLGASIALLTAPASGEHTRLALAREIRKRRPWKRSPWDSLGAELLKMSRRRGRRRAEV